MTRLRRLSVVLAVALAACSKVTEENFATVEQGMTEQQVIAILGSPSESSSVDVLGVSGTVYRWSSRDAVASVRFVNGKAALKHWEKPTAR